MENVLFRVIFLPLVCGVDLRVNEIPSTTEGFYGFTPKNYDTSGDGYGFSYGVSDPNTGDHKTHWEKRQNGVVSGAYSLLEPDGSTRLVRYRADDSGFHPSVQKVFQNSQSFSSLPHPSTTSTPFYNRSPFYNNPPVSSTSGSYQFYPNTGYNYNGRYYFPDKASYRPGLTDFGDGHFNSYGGYDSSYRRAEVAPYYRGRNRQRGQRIPLLYSTYHDVEP